MMKLTIARVARTVEKPIDVSGSMKSFVSSPLGGKKSREGMFWN